MSLSGTTTFNLDYYLAGVFDGEGCVSISLTKKSYITLSVQVSMCDRAPVSLLHERFGGRFSDGTAKTKTGRAVYTWIVFNADAVEALELFADKCLVKCEVAKIALPVARTMRNNHTRNVLSQEEKVSRLEAAQAIAKINKPVGPRRALDPVLCAAYLTPKKLGGGKKIRLSDGRLFNTVRAAAKELKVSEIAVSYAARKKTRVAGNFAEYA